MTTKQVCHKNVAKAARFSTIKRVCYGMTLDTVKAGEAITRSLRDKKDTCLNIPEIMRVAKMRVHGYKVGSHDWNKPFNDDRFKEEKMFKDGLPSDDDCEVTTPLTETYYNRELLIEAMTPERLAMASENHRYRFRNALGEDEGSDIPFIPFWAKVLFDERPFSLLRI